MRPVTGGRWILGILVVGPMLVIQLIYVVLIVQAGLSQAQAKNPAMMVADADDGTAGAAGFAAMLNENAAELAAHEPQVVRPLQSHRLRREDVESSRETQSRSK